jgi:hypothetical protein
MDILHFDTIDSMYIKNCYNTIFRLFNPLRNIKNIYLKSLEMPVVFDNIRSDNTSNIITLKVNNAVVNVNLDTKNYNNINTLLSDINTKLVATNITLTILNGIVSINIPIISNITIENSVLINTVLGFPKNTPYTSTNKVTAVSHYTLNYDNYLSLYVDIPSSNNASSNKLISFKIPLNALENMVFYLGDNSTFSQSIKISDPNYVLSQFRITVYDRFGYTISQCLDYTFTLGIEYDVSF